MRQPSPPPLVVANAALSLPEVNLGGEIREINSAVIRSPTVHASGMPSPTQVSAPVSSAAGRIFLCCLSVLPPQPPTDIAVAAQLQLACLFVAFRSSESLVDCEPFGVILKSAQPGKCLIQAHPVSPSPRAAARESAAVQPLIHPPLPDAPLPNLLPPAIFRRLLPHHHRCSSDINASPGFVVL